MSASAIDWSDMLASQRADHRRKIEMAAVSVFRDGTYRIWSVMDAEIAEKCEPDYLVTIELEARLADIGGRDPV